MKYFEKKISLNGNTYRVVMVGSNIEISVKSGYSFRALHTAPVRARVLAAMAEADHAEALAMNAEVDAVKAATTNLAFHIFWYKSDIADLLKANRVWCSMVDEAHAMNEAIDRWTRPGAKSNEHLRLSITEAHAEAIEFDATLNEALTDISPRHFALLDEHSKSLAVKYAHAEALAMNETFTTQKKARGNSLTQKIGMAFAGAALLMSGLAHAEVVPSYPVDASRMSLNGSVAVSIDCDSKKVDVVRESTSAAYFSKQVKKQVWNICYGQTGVLDRVYTFVMNKQVGAHDMIVNNSDRHPL